MRTLIHVSVIHSEADLGSAVFRARGRYDPETWARHQHEIQQYWRDICRDLDRLNLDWSQVKLYHDSLPVGGEVGREIVRSLAARGSPDYRLVQALMAKGAVLQPTEDPGLLLQEYDLVRSGAAVPKEELDRLLLARDRYMAARIAETLAEGETGILFVGAAHRVTRFLPGDIRIVFLPSRLKQAQP